ncbi:GNAT family N-acetyltransferase [Ensifer sp. ENS06]|uniref:GNAT family N-acetyltransferase n=1 Tax=Ensifer sp. ENS06 TaxID=2769276 RepID=UPI0017860784|nr:GNAT family N-acetyltransferase [Ensifer sp. ENS06]MBD9622368.1 GNAT family N-acetyltransferase [Ensifer sp. ENS06]
MSVLRSPQPDQAAALSDLCLRSKAVWGYDPAFLEACRAALTLTADDWMDSDLQVAMEGERILGLAQVRGSGQVVELDKLFIEPEARAAGIGRQLFDWCVAAARKRGATVMTIDADPGAADFYRRVGAVDDGVVASSVIPGRFLPRLKVDLASGPTA